MFFKGGWSLQCLLVIRCDIGGDHLHLILVGGWDGVVVGVPLPGPLKLGLLHDLYLPFCSFKLPFQV